MSPEVPQLAQVPISREQTLADVMLWSSLLPDVSLVEVLCLCQRAHQRCNQHPQLSVETQVTPWATATSAQASTASCKQEPCICLS